MKRVLKIIGGLVVVAIILWLVTYRGEPMTAEQIIQYQVELARGEAALFARKEEALFARKEEIARERACDNRSWFGLVGTNLCGARP